MDDENFGLTYIGNGRWARYTKIRTTPPPGENTDLAGLSASDARAVRSLTKNVQTNRVKIAAYRANPDALDNKGWLKYAPSPAIRRAIIAGRIKHLEEEIRAWQQAITRIESR
jgi:hypothetical protein